MTSRGHLDSPEEAVEIVNLSPISDNSTEGASFRYNHQAYPGWYRIAYQMRTTEASIVAFECVEDDDRRSRTVAFHGKAGQITHTAMVYFDSPGAQVHINLVQRHDMPHVQMLAMSRTSVPKVVSFYLWKSFQRNGLTEMWDLSLFSLQNTWRILGDFATFKQRFRELLQESEKVSDELYQRFYLPSRSFFQRHRSAYSEMVDGFAHKPKISILVPVYNTPAKFLVECIESVRRQLYTNWQLCLVNDASPDPVIKPILDRYASKDRRIFVAHRQDGGHICNATNDALEMAEGEWVAFLDHDDTITEDALFEVVRRINQVDDQCDLIYSDEDKIDEEGLYFNPHFKPDWSPDLLSTTMYTCHLSVYRRAHVLEIGGLRPGFEGSQDWDLALRYTERFTHIEHIPLVLYHWRMLEGSTAADSNAKPYTQTASIKAITEAMKRSGAEGRVDPHPQFRGHFIARYQTKDEPRVTIIIPTRDGGKVLRRCLDSLFEKTAYTNFHVVVVDNGSMDPETMNIIALYRREYSGRFKALRIDRPFNYSMLNNMGAREGDGDLILLLNDDTEVVRDEWLDEMVGQAVRPEIGAVGVRLLYPNGQVQHAGVVTGVAGIASHPMRNLMNGHPGYFGRLCGTYNTSAVTGACLMTRRDIWEELGGLDESLAVAYNDVDFCLRVWGRGLRVVQLNQTYLVHHESISRGYEITDEKKQRLEYEGNILKEKWGERIDNDPFYNPWLTKRNEDYDVIALGEPIPPHGPFGGSVFSS